MKLEPMSLKRSDRLRERWVQEQIVNDPSILGLGDVVVKDKERRQGNAGRLVLKSYFNDEREGRRAFSREKVSLSTVERAFRQPQREPWSHLADAPIFLSKNVAAFTAVLNRQPGRGPVAPL